MKLLRISYEQNKYHGQDLWMLKDLILNDINLITGKNATGKTRTLNLIHNLAMMISRRRALLNGKWDVEFLNGHKQYRYVLDVRNNKTHKEILTCNSKELLVRSLTDTKLFSYKSHDSSQIKPPSNQLVLHIRRDKEEYPYFEELVQWAEGVEGFEFATSNSEILEIPSNMSFLPLNLNSVPYFINKLDDKTKSIVIKEINSLGFNIDNLQVRSIYKYQKGEANILKVKEKGINWLNQSDVADGMFRALALIIIINYISIGSNKTSTLIIDDFGEGLDFNRSKKLAKLVYKKAKKMKLQLIITSNDYFLINVTDTKYWNILNRSGSIVKAVNYSNNKKKFDDFKFTGLNNFDLLTSSSF